MAITSFDVGIHCLSGDGRRSLPIETLGAAGLD